MLSRQTKKRFIDPFIVAFGFAFFIVYLSSAQNFIVLNADLGNKITIEPHQKGLIKTPIAPSGSISLLRFENITNEWFFQYGVVVGVLGSNFKYREEFDTISVGNDPNFYTNNRNYNTVYCSVEMNTGPDILILGRRVGLSFGGGITVAKTFPLETTSSRCEVQPCEVVFQYEIYEAERISWFVQIGAQTELSPRMIAGVRYKVHFSELVSGTYNFHHVANPPAGQLSIVPRTLNLFVGIRIGKR